jgi:hypothetical protein
MTYVQQPDGFGNGAFDTADLLLTMQQDAWTSVVYFSGASDDLICTDSVLNPAVQWCAPRAEQWVPSATLPCVYQHHVPVVPEPTMLGLMILFVIAIIVWRNTRD